MGLNCGSMAKAAREATAKAVSTAFPSARFVLRANRPAYIGVSLHLCPWGKCGVDKIHIWRI
jgi:hypothetical protein